MAWMVFPNPISSARITELCLVKPEIETCDLPPPVQCGASCSLAPSVSQPVQPIQLVVPQLEALLLAQPWGLVLHYPEPWPVLEDLVAPPRDAVRVVASDEGVDLLLEESGDYLRALPCAL